jgi:hypothetical protein
LYRFVLLKSFRQTGKLPPIGSARTLLNDPE